MNPNESVKFCAACATDVGRKRKHNEDSVLCRHDLGLFIVADGMGGHNAGDYASALAVDSIVRFFETTEVDFGIESVTPPNPDTDPGASRLVLAIRRANEEIVHAAQGDATRTGMGTTVVAMYLATNGMIHIAHVGDSRCYRVGADDIEQVTQDHSFLNNVIWSQPNLGDDVVAAIPKNVITRALGTHEAVEVEVRSEMTLPGDAYLLCSDGLSGMISASSIREVVDSIGDPEKACAELIARANHAGGRDNVSVVIVRIDDRSDTIPHSQIDDDKLANGPLRYDRSIGEWVCSACGRAHVEGTSFCVECGVAFQPKS